MKRGQIADLDHDPTNNEPDNLAYLCLEHHDWYDTRPSQSKRLTLSELRHFRRELHEAIDQEWRKSAVIAHLSTPQLDVTGHYIREDSYSNAEIVVQELPGAMVRVSGFALWGTSRPSGPNIGKIDFEAPLQNGVVIFRDRRGQQEYRLELSFADGSLTVQEQYVIGYFGLNVTFEGTYTRAPGAT